MTGELQETATCSAITEKRPNRLGGCVGVFFQLFDWNRRFTKKKLFSRKSLFPGKQGSKRFGRDDKMLKSKLNLIDDENRGSFPNRGELVELKKHEMRPPSLVARLMGLDSLPSTHRDKVKKKKPSHQTQDKDKCGMFDEEEEGEDNGFDKSRPQKMQRTTTGGVCDRRGVMVKKFVGSEAMQIKNVLTRVRKHQHQKLASPVRSPRLHNRRNSRLVDAAVRILEPGRRNAKYAIAYPGSTGVRRCNNVGKELVEVVVSSDYNNNVASCKACGSFVDVHGSSPIAEETGNNMAFVAESKPFERSKRNVFWRNQEPSMSVVSGKGRDFTDPMEMKSLHPARFPPLVAQSYTFQSKRGCSSSPVNATNCKEKDFVAMNRAATSSNYHHSKARFEKPDLNLQRKSHTRVEEASNRSGFSTPARKRRLACVSGQGQGSSSMSPVSRRLDVESSCACSHETAFPPLKHGSPHRETKERKGVPSQMGERNLRTPLDASTVGLIQQKLKELASQEEDESTRGSALPNKPASLILHELLSSITQEQPYAETACLRKGKTEMWSSIGNANSDYTSPGSVLDASFSNESCFSNSFDNISVPGPDWDVLEDSAALCKNSTSSGNYQAVTSLISHVSNVLRCLSNIGFVSTQQRLTNAREVILHTELLLGGTTTQDNYIIGPELFDELLIYAARSEHLVNLTGITGGFLVDAMIEHLEERNISCGLKPSPSAEPSSLIRGVLKEVPKWAALARIDMDEVIDIEMENWVELETYSLGVGSEIAYEILCCLVGELAIDLF
ncbi:DnaA initiator-associating protein [Hirschfeldia incana]|nr:DnaA initiator-associating protein [Hirschfeldia incana]